MKFSKTKFLQNASFGIQMILKHHINILDGKDVNENGEIYYQVDNKNYCLCPIDQDWCEEDEHEK